MRSRMSPERYRDVPKWVREGVAVWVAGQLPERLTLLACDPDAITQPESAILGLDNESHSVERYAEYALAVEHLIDQKGNAALVQLARRLEAGETAIDAVAAESGQTWPAFVSAAKKHATKRVREARRPEADEAAAIFAADKARKYDEVLKLSEAFNRKHRESPLLGNVLYFRGKAARLRDKRQLAETALRRLLNNHRADCSYIEEGLYQLAMVRVEAKAWSDAITPLKEIMLDHPASTQIDKVVYNLALCRSKTGGKREALRLLDLFDRSFKESKVLEDARKLRRDLEKDR